MDSSDSDCPVRATSSFRLKKYWEEKPKAKRVFQKRDKEKNPKKFRESTRMTPVQFQTLLERVRGEFEPTTKRSNALSAAEKLKTALHYFATGDFLWSTASSNKISKATAHKCVKEVQNAILSSLQDQIRYENTSQNNILNFFELSGIDGVIGAVDGSHIPVKLYGQKENEPHFVNRKNFHSVNMLAAVDSVGRFLYVNCNFPGATHDSPILQMSSLPSFYSGPNPPGILLADRGFPSNLPWLVTTHTAPNARDHAKARGVVEHAFGTLKQKFQVLNFPLRKQNIKNACKTALVCCYLYNFLINHPPESEAGPSSST